jgi:hypothetical protein
VDEVWVVLVDCRDCGLPADLVAAREYDDATQEIGRQVLIARCVTMEHTHRLEDAR